MFFLFSAPGVVPRPLSCAVLYPFPGKLSLNAVKIPVERMLPPSNRRYRHGFGAEGGRERRQILLAIFFCIYIYYFLTIIG